MFKGHSTAKIVIRINCTVAVWAGVLKTHYLYSLCGTFVRNVKEETQFALTSPKYDFLEGLQNAERPFVLTFHHRSDKPQWDPG